MTGIQPDHTVVLPAPFGSVRLLFADKQLISCELSYRKPRATPAELPEYTQAGINALKRYFKSGQLPASLTIPIQGTEFQQRVWSQLRAIPPGETATYGEIAARLSSGARAVANACRQNPLPLFIPCHRVVAANGMGGFMGQRAGKELGIKQWLLRHEARL